MVWARHQLKKPYFTPFFYSPSFYHSRTSLVIPILTLTGCIICVLTSNVSRRLVWVIRSESCRRLSMIRFLIAPAQVTTLCHFVASSLFFLSLFNYWPCTIQFNTGPSPIGIPTSRHRWRASHQQLRLVQFGRGSQQPVKPAALQR